MGFQGIFKGAFPFLAAAASIGGPAAVMATNFVGKALGIDNLTPDRMPDAVANATTKDPDAMLKLKQAEDDFQLQMTKLGFDNAEKLLSIDAADRASARSREIAVKDKTPAVLAYGVTLGFFSLLWLLAFHSIPLESQRILDVMVGALGTAWISVVTYYFGSSLGSSEKTRILAAGTPSNPK